MADKENIVKENVPGLYYVDSECIDCDACRDAAPGFPPDSCRNVHDLLAMCCVDGPGGICSAPRRKCLAAKDRLKRGKSCVG